VAVVLKWSLFRGWTINIKKLEIKLAWQLQTGGCCSESVVNKDFTELKTKYEHFFQDIKASHVAIEAPIQVLLKISLFLMGILDPPGLLHFRLKK
jgi:hypothetical protein